MGVTNMCRQSPLVHQGPTATTTGGAGPEAGPLQPNGPLARLGPGWPGSRPLPWPPWAWGGPGWWGQVPPQVCDTTWGFVFLGFAVGPCAPLCALMVFLPPTLCTLCPSCVLRLCGCGCSCCAALVALPLLCSLLSVPSPCPNSQCDKMLVHTEKHLCDGSASQTDVTFHFVSGEGSWVGEVGWSFNRRWTYHVG